MEIIRGKDFELKNTCVTIGKFDGVHIGHRTVLETVKKISEETDLKSVVLTFDFSYFNTENGERLNTFTEKTELIEECGIDIFIDYPFDDETRNLSCETFAENVLAKQLNTKAVIVGENFRFGKGAEGDTSVLKQLGRIYGFKTIVIPSVCYEGVTVSSTRIREELLRGNREKAGFMLGINAKEGTDYD